MPKQRDLFIDFLKGLCIISVVLTHNLPPVVMKASVFVLWGAMAVPLFLTLQSYHVFHRGMRSDKKLKDYYSWQNIWHRILKPFAIITLASGAILVIAGHNPIATIKGAVISGGIGPGSYYVWIYLQFALLLPICLTLFNKMGGGISTCLLFILISQGVEWLCIYIDIPEPLYRLTCLRYLFLIYFGYLWTTNKMSKNITSKQIWLSLLSALALIALYYSTGSLKPFLHDTAWRSFHWICYFWVALMLPWLIWKLFDKPPPAIKNMVGEMGQWSYEIFLLQMLVFTVYPHRLLDTGNNYINVAMYIIFTMCASIMPVIAYKRWRIRRNVLASK